MPTTPFRIIAAVALAASAALTSAQTIQRSPDTAPDFEVEVYCEDGAGHIALLDANSGSSVEIGSVGRDGARAEPTTQLLRPLTRAWIGKQLFGEQRPSRDSVFDTDLQRDLIACGGRPDSAHPPSTGCIDGAGWCFCIPDEGSGDCDAFHTFCAAIGGQSNHNSCSF